ncbi:MAG TPA: porin [Geminicoccus sp.]|uniref:porin n=1 Tax=Geminicoccus sp. TaxID=2024832 RepID=UPI002C6EFB13|nr:porin [Geminicoccus sp.]HWL69768.1 porin [Geminicoccus sp.]
MRIKTLLLAGVASGVVAAAGAANAAEVMPGGALDITLSGQLRAGVLFGENDSISGNDPGYGMYTNNRVFIDVRGKDDGSLMEYGGRFRLRFDNGRGSNNNIVDRSWLFIRGGWGEVRLGNEVGPGDNSKVFSSVIAAGTGGIDGDFNPAFGNSVYTYVVPLSGAATKVVYYTPEIAGFQAGVSFAPDDDAGGLVSQNDDSDQGGRQHVEGAITYKGAFSGVDILAGVTASTAKFGPDDEDLNGISGGVSLGLFGFNLAGAYGHNGGDLADVDYWNIGIGGSFGPAKLALEYSQADGNVDPLLGGTPGDSTPTAIVLSGTMGIMPGVSLLTDIGLYDTDLPGSDENFAGLVAVDIQF